MNDDQGERDTTDDAPRPEPNAVSVKSSDTFLHRFLNAEDGILLFVRETLVSVSAVVAIGLLLFAISGVWPPMVAVESGSMEPHMYRGDLIFITAPDRFTPDYAYEDTGIVTVDIGSEKEFSSFNGPGSVIVYDPPSRAGSPIIHRARFYVEAEENWYDKANPNYINADSCAELRNCPAPHAGFITKGDANGRYDQASGIAEPVKTEWIDGVAHVRIPYLGYVRLELAGMFAPMPVASEAGSVDAQTHIAPDFESTNQTVSVV
ncbi:S26 family signal peptidase [Halogeometricum borinquense]|uniref:S26 family signal peptidase n=1 Tax=Halogeometricum borinquense TaxID=60847 RepID=A0A6C0UM47_9EURY|nr:S26 family signal peptidase [Halogeometricum borinquense]QIB76317.1 S26 family signal peptidase [Halogeometricum borinquense]QIQ75247.1 S26 family signal peptidase [Halogeometricum borinquense]